MTSILNKFDHSTTLSIPKDTSFYFEFNPRTMISFDKGRYYFPYFNAYGNWGEIKVSKEGGIFNDDFVKVAYKENKVTISGNQISYANNWILILKDNWHIVKKGKNYYVVMKHKDF